MFVIGCVLACLAFANSNGVAISSVALLLYVWILISAAKAEQSLFCVDSAPFRHMLCYISYFAHRCSAHKASINTWHVFKMVPAFDRWDLLCSFIKAGSGWQRLLCGEAAVRFHRSDTKLSHFGSVAELQVRSAGLAQVCHLFVLCVGVFGVLCAGLVAAADGLCFSQRVRLLRRLQPAAS